MTVATTTREVTYAAGTFSSPFSQELPFKVYKASDLYVYNNGMLDNKSGFTLTYPGSDSFSDNDNPVLNITSPATGHDIVVVRRTEQIQDVDFREVGLVSSAELNDAMDRATMCSLESISRDAIGGVWGLGTKRLRRVQTPTEDTDAANRLYIDSSMTEKGYLPPVSSVNSQSRLQAKGADQAIWQDDKSVPINASSTAKQLRVDPDADTGPSYKIGNWATTTGQASPKWLSYTSAQAWREIREIPDYSGSLPANNALRTASAAAAWQTSLDVPLRGPSSTRRVLTTYRGVPAVLTFKHGLYNDCTGYDAYDNSAGDPICDASAYDPVYSWYTKPPCAGGAAPSHGVGFWQSHLSKMWIFSIYHGMDMPVENIHVFIGSPKKAHLSTNANSAFHVTNMGNNHFEVQTTRWVNTEAIGTKHAVYLYWFAWALTDEVTGECMCPSGDGWSS